MDFDHTGWDFSKVISRLVSLGCSLCVDPNIIDLFYREHPEILAVIGVGYGKSGFWRKKALIFLKRNEIGASLLFRTNGKSHKRFRLVPTPLELHLTTSELWFGQEQEGILP